MLTLYYENMDCTFVFKHGNMQKKVSGCVVYSFLSFPTDGVE
jgi:hypothetical protein